MKRFLELVLNISKVMNGVAGVALTLMMGLTVVDVFGRAGGYPILGTFEIVSLFAIVVTAFALPLATWQRRHVYMELLLEKLPRRNRDILNVSTRIFCIVLFIIMGINLFQVGAEFARAREVTTALDIPLFPAAYAAGFCCFVQVVALACDVVKIWEGKYE
jgi:TRAP-type C4-dicarboxylate transport system permease small subunit